jgi:hypothetical protein
MLRRAAVSIHALEIGGARQSLLPDGLRHRKLRRQPGTAAVAAALEQRSAGSCGHSVSETVLLCSATLVGLVGALHNAGSIERSGEPCRGWGFGSCCSPFLQRQPSAVGLGITVGKTWGRRAQFCGSGGEFLGKQRRSPDFWPKIAGASVEVRLPLPHASPTLPSSVFGAWLRQISAGVPVKDRVQGWNGEEEMGVVA